MRCPECNFDNPAGTTFCEECGAVLGASGSVSPPPAPHQKRKTMIDMGVEAPTPPRADVFANPSPRSPVDLTDPFQSTVPNAPRPTTPRATATAVPELDRAFEPTGAPPSPRPTVPPDFESAFEPVAATPRVPPPAPQAPLRSPAPVDKKSTLLDLSPAAESPALRGALVVFTHPADPGTLVPLAGDRFTIGRDAGQDLMLDDDRVSANHALIFLDAAGARLMDVSSNGSVVDGHPLRGATAPLGHGSVIALGQHRLVVMLLPDASLQAVRGT